MDDDNKVISFRTGTTFNPRAAAACALEDDGYDILYDAVDKLIGMDLTAIQITGLLFLTMRRFSEQADTW